MKQKPNRKRPSFAFRLSRKLLWTLLVEVVGCLLMAIGIYNFAVLSEFPLTGFSGLAIIVYRLYGIPIGLTNILLNIPVALLCYRLLGKRFFVHSLFCMLLSSLMVDYLAPLFPAYAGNRLLSAICCGVISGIGCAMIYMQHSSTGGSDFITMAIKAKRPYLSIGRISFCADLGVILLGGLIFRDVDGIIYGIIINYLCAIVVDKVMYGANAGKLMMIVTDQSGLVTQMIEQVSGRGSTVWQARGGYQGEEREIVMCACDTKQMYTVQKAAKAVDPRSFIIISESYEVHGEGFAPVVIGEKEAEGGA